MKKKTPKIKMKRSKLMESRDPITKKDVQGTPTFEEGIQRILEKFKFPAETRREIFSQISKYASAQKPKKGNQNDDNQ
jgi:hypothetical protein